MSAVDARPRSELNKLFRLAVPISLAQLGLVAMGLVDTAIIGRLDVDSLAGTAIGRSIVLAASSIGMGIGYALEPLAAQAVGAGDFGRAWSALRTTLLVGALVTIPSVLLTFLTVLALEPLGVEPKLVPIVTDFLIGHAPGLFAFSAYIAGREFLAAHGSALPALIAAAVANLANAILGGLLIHGDNALLYLGLPALGLPQLGALGAGLATSAASVVLAAIVLYAARKYRPPTVDAAMSKKTVLRLGLPIGFQLLAEIGIFSFVALLAGRLGSVAASANQVGFALVNFTFMGAYGIGAATAVRVGNAIGAGESPRRIGTMGLAMGLSMMAVTATLFALLPTQLVALFTPDADVIQAGAALLSIAAVFQLFDGVQGVASGALRGAGDVRFPFVANLCAHWLVGLPIALLLGFHFEWGVRGLWWGLTTGLVTIAITLVSRFYWLTRKRLEQVG